jgi:nucleotide-binding universal stress UspA family protein
MRIVVPVEPGEESERLVAEAVLLAGDCGAVVAVAAIEVPLDLPLDLPLAAVEADLRQALAQARSIGAAHGVAVRTRLVRTRAAAEAILDAAAADGADVIVVGMRRAQRLGRVEELVLRHAACRVLVAAS